MEDLTSQLLNRLWAGAPRFSEVAFRLRNECSTMSPLAAALIGRDLLLRHRQLEGPIFAFAAYLASDGTAGNDGLLDFSDCVTILPESRFRRIVDNPDNLAEEEGLLDFGEFGFYSEVAGVFESPFGEEGEGLLSYLVFGSGPSILTTPLVDVETVVPSLLPKLFSKYGYLLNRSNEGLPTTARFDSVATLRDFIGEEQT